MSKKKTDKELEQNLDQETMHYFEHLSEDDAPGQDDDKIDNEIDWDEVKLSRNRRAEEEEQKKSDLQKFQDEMAEAEHVAYLKSILPKRLQEFRHYISANVEENWIIHIWNQVIDAKLIIKDRTRNTYAINQKGNKVRKQKYRKTNQSDKVTSYNQLKGRYNNKRTWQAMELRIRKIAFLALGMSNKIYNASDWISFINTNNVDEHQDLSNLIVDQLDMGFKI